MPDQEQAPASVTYRPSAGDWPDFTEFTWRCAEDGASGITDTESDVITAINSHTDEHHPQNTRLADLA